MLWGHSVFHCPFCHGWEVREKSLGVLGGDSSGVDRALLLNAWSDDVTLLSDGPHDLDPEQRARLEAGRIGLDQRLIAELEGEAGALGAVVFADGSRRTLGGLLVPVTLHQRTDLAARLGVETASAGALSAESVAVDAAHATSVPGVFTAGDLTSQMPSVADAIAAGAAAAGAIVHEITARL